MVKIFQFSPMAVGEILVKDLTLPGCSEQSFEDYKATVSRRLATYLFTHAHDRLGSNYLLAHKYGMSIRNLQRYQQSIELPDLFLHIMYDLQQ